MTELNDSIVGSLDRRRMLQVVGAAGAAGVLAACGGGTSDSADSGTTPDDAAPDDTGSEEPDEPGESSDQGGDEGADTLAATSDVPVGSGVIVGGVVVTQPAEGDFRAFSSTCTHQGCTVSDVSDGVISCPCHGSQFSAEDGSVQNGPATEALPEVEISVEGDQIIRG